MDCSKKSNTLGIKIPKRQKHVYHYFIDNAGRWFCEGNEVADRELFKLLSLSLFEYKGRYFVRCEGEIHPVEVADAPLWIKYIHVRKTSEGAIEGIELELTDGRMEPLNPKEIWLEGESALYCRVTKKKLKARFGKVAYYELAQLMEWNPEKDVYEIKLVNDVITIKPS